MNKRQIVRKTLLLAVITVIFLTGCGSLSYTSVTERSTFCFDTVVSVSIYKGDISALDDALKMCASYEKIFSAADEDSELYRLNHRTGCTFEASDELAGLIKDALEMCRRTDGAFDITILPAKSLWDFGCGEGELPEREDLENALELVDWEKVTVEGNTVTFPDDMMQIDLGACAKGYIADRLADLLREKGVESAVINLGGNVLCVGEKPKNRDFIVGIRKPNGSSERTAADLKIRNASVVTSGTYERFVTVGDIKYHHILNPATGFPFETDIMSATVICKSSEQADMLSTACICLGSSEAIKLIDSTEGVEAVLIDNHGKLIKSAGADDYIM